MPISATNWNYNELPGEYMDVVFIAYIGAPGSAMRRFIRENHKQWNVRNWVDHACTEFSNLWIQTGFQMVYTPKHDIGARETMRGMFQRIAESKIDKDTNELMLRVNLQLFRTKPEDVYGTFGCGGNFFFFGGEFEAEKVDDSDWYDVRRFELKTLNFMDKLGRVTQSLPA